MNKVVPIQTVEPMRPRDYSSKQLQLVKNTVAADCNNLEFDLFVEVARRVGLDPFRRQIYAVVYNKDKPDKRKMSIITGIDGFRAVAARNGDYRPDDEEPLIVTDPDLKNPATNPLGIERAVYTAYKRGPNGEWFAVKASAYWDEFAPLNEIWEEGDDGRRRPAGKFELPATSNWRKMPRVMIVKCAEAQALRKGWPEDLSGVYAEEEMARTMEDATASEAVARFEQDERTKLVGAKGSVPIIWQAGDEIAMVPVGQIADRVMAFLREAESPTQIEVFNRQNRAGLQQFWAMEKSDALALKKAMEDRVEELSKEPDPAESPIIEGELFHGQ